MIISLDDVKKLKEIIFTTLEFRNLKQKIINTGTNEIEFKPIGPRNRTRIQIRKARALCNEIAVWCGHEPEYIYEHMKHDFCTR